MRSLSPEDIKRENAFRTAQRKAGKSRKGNLKDPNAPKKPLSAYFMFLQRIRSDPALVLEVFGEETETTKQSVLAAAKWRSMTDEERKVQLVSSCVIVSACLTYFCRTAFPRPGRAGEARVRGCAEDVRRRHDGFALEHQLQHPPQQPDQLHLLPLVQLPPHRQAGGNGLRERGRRREGGK